MRDIDNDGLPGIARSWLEENHGHYTSYYGKDPRRLDSILKAEELRNEVNDLG
jgi:hypothetical protein